MTAAETLGEKGVHLAVIVQEQHYFRVDEAADQELGPNNEGKRHVDRCTCIPEGRGGQNNLEVPKFLRILGLAKPKPR